MQTELLTYENDTDVPTTRRFIRDGIAGNYDVIYEMDHLAPAQNRQAAQPNLLTLCGLSIMRGR